MRNTRYIFQTGLATSASIAATNPICYVSTPNTTENSAGTSRPIFRISGPYPGKPRNPGRKWPSWDRLQAPWSRPNG